MSGPIQEDVQTLGALLNQLLRVCRIGQIHLPNNAAVSQTVDTAAKFFSTLGGGAPVERISLLFVDDTMYVNGALVRATPEFYESSATLGAMLDRVGLNELTVDPGVTAEDLRGLARVFSEARDPEAEAGQGSLRLRRIDPELLAALRDANVPTRERLKQSYASAMVVLRVVYEGICAGRLVVPSNLRAMVRQFVLLADSDPAAFRNLASARAAHHDDAGTAVRAMLVSVAMVRQLGGSPKEQVAAGMAALLADLGRARAALFGVPESSLPLRAIPRLDAAQQERAPAAAATAVLAFGRLNGDAIDRATIVRQVQALTQRDAAGADLPDDGLAIAAIARVARLYAEWTTYDLMLQAAPTAAEAIGELMSAYAETPLLRWIELLDATIVRRDGGSTQRTVAHRPPTNDDTGESTYGDASGPSWSGRGLRREEPSAMSTSRPVLRPSAAPSAAETPRPSWRDDADGDDDFLHISVEDDNAQTAPPAPGEPVAAAAPSSAAPSAGAVPDQFADILSDYFGPQGASAVPARTAPPDPPRIDTIERMPIGDDDGPETPTVPVSAGHMQSILASHGRAPRGRRGAAAPSSNESDPGSPSGLTARFRLSVDPGTGTLHASTDDGEGAGGSASPTQTTMPGRPALEPSHGVRHLAGADSSDFGPTERFTPTASIRRAVLPPSSSQDLNDSSSFEVGEPDEYDVEAADAERAAATATRSAALVSRAKTPPRPLPAVLGRVGSVRPDADTPASTPAVTTPKRSAPVTGAQKALAPSELRRALGGPTTQRNDVPAELAQTVDQPELSAQVRGSTRPLGGLAAVAADAAAQRRAADPTGPRPAVADWDSPRAAAASPSVPASSPRTPPLGAMPVADWDEPSPPSAPRNRPGSGPAPLVTERADTPPRPARGATLHFDSDELGVPEVHPRGGQTVDLSDEIARAVQDALVARTPGAHAGTPNPAPAVELGPPPPVATVAPPPAAPSAAAPREAAESARPGDPSWGTKQTIDIGAVQAKRFLEAYARAQVRRGGPSPSDAPEAPDSSAHGAPPPPVAQQPRPPGRTPAPSASNVSLSEARAQNSPRSRAPSAPEAAPAPTARRAEATPRDSANAEVPNAWRRDPGTVRKIRQARASGSFGKPEPQQPSVDEMLRKYLKGEK